MEKIITNAPPPISAPNKNLKTEGGGGGWGVKAKKNEKIGKIRPIPRSEVTAQERQEVLDIHNDYRRKIANQQQPNFG